MSDATEFNHGTETTNTANQGAAMSNEHDCFDRFDFESLPGPQSPVTPMNDYGPKRDFELALSPNLDEFDVGHSMGGTERSVNAGPAGGRHQQQRPGFGACGTVITGTYQLPRQNTLFMFGSPQSASNTASHNPNPSNLSGDPSPPTNPNLPVFRSRPRAYRGAAPSTSGQSLTLYERSREGRLGPVKSIVEGPSQAGTTIKRRAIDDEGSEKNSREDIHNKFQKLTLDGEEA
jgi:hypothetical protein